MYVKHVCKNSDKICILKMYPKKLKMYAKKLKMHLKIINKCEIIDLMWKMYVKSDKIRILKMCVKLSKYVCGKCM